MQRRVELIEGGGDDDGGESSRICACAYGSCTWTDAPPPPPPTNACGGNDSYCITDCSRAACALVGDPRVTGPTPCWYNRAHERQVCGCRQNTCDWISFSNHAGGAIRRLPPETIRKPEFGLLNAIIHAPNDKVRARLIKNLERFQARYNGKFDTLESTELPENTMYINATKRVRILFWHVSVNNEYHANADGIVVAVVKNFWGRILPNEVSTTPIQPRPPELAPTA